MHCLTSVSASACIKWLSLPRRISSRTLGDAKHPLLFPPHTVSFPIAEVGSNASYFPPVASKSFLNTPQSSHNHSLGEKEGSYYWIISNFFPPTETVNCLFFVNSSLPKQHGYGQVTLKSAYEGTKVVIMWLNSLIYQATWKLQVKKCYLTHLKYTKQIYASPGLTAASEWDGRTENTLISCFEAQSRCHFLPEPTLLCLCALTCYFTMIYNGHNQRSLILFFLNAFSSSILSNYQTHVGWNWSLLDLRLETEQWRP